MLKFKNTQLHMVSCHRMPSRSFFWKGKQFPVCARCTGIHLGYLSFPIFTFDLFTLDFIWTLLFIIPTYLDGLIQAYFNIESNNIRRVTTGLMAGIGSMSLVSIIGKNIGQLILTII